MKSQTKLQLIKLKQVLAFACLLIFTGVSAQDRYYGSSREVGYQIGTIQQVRLQIDFISLKVVILEIISTLELALGFS